MPGNAASSGATALPSYRRCTATSASWTATPRARNMAAVVLFPMPMEPVRPITRISVASLPVRTLPRRPPHAPSSERPCRLERPDAPGRPGGPAAGTSLKDSFHALLPQEAKQRQERQAQDGKIITLDGLEELNAQAFKLVRADALQRRLACPGKIAPQGGGLETAHPQRGRLDGVPDDLAILRAGYGRMELMRAARQPKQLPARGFHIRRLGQPFSREIEHLIGADDQVA